MNERFFLYIDILGFTDLVQSGSDKINDLYEVIASLNAHRHDAFKVVVFSDTIVVYNVNGGDTHEDARYLVMFLSEFVKDLLHRLTGRDIYFRAILTYGDFTHYELNGIPCFFGNALVDAHNSEKEIKSVGLFIHKKIAHYCDIFKHREFNEDYNFVYVTQSLRDVENYGYSGYPIIWDLIGGTEAEWQIYPEANHVREMYYGFINNNYPESVKTKYQSSWNMYCKQYPNFTSHLLGNDFDIFTICPSADWDRVEKRHPESCTYAIESKKTY